MVRGLVAVAAQGQPPSVRCVRRVSEKGRAQAEGTNGTISCAGDRGDGPEPDFAQSGLISD